MPSSSTRALNSIQPNSRLKSRGSVLADSSIICSFGLCVIGCSSAGKITAGCDNSMKFSVTKDKCGCNRVFIALCQKRILRLETTRGELCMKTKRFAMALSALMALALSTSCGGGADQAPGGGLVKLQGA